MFGEIGEKVLNQNENQGRIGLVFFIAAYQLTPISIHTTYELDTLPLSLWSKKIKAIIRQPWYITHSNNLREKLAPRLSCKVVRGKKR